jgi:Mg2+ and Co2+ transporter CorA
MAIRALLYSADAPDRELDELAQVEVGALTDRQLLWIDLASAEPAEREQVARFLGCEPGLLALDAHHKHRPTLANYGNLFRLTAMAVGLPQAHQKAQPRWMALLAGPNYVVSVHNGDIDFVEELRQREKGDTGIGALSAESFVASLLDWMLNSYFQALEVVVREIDSMEVAILGKRKLGTGNRLLETLIEARRRVAEVRRLLIAHRDVFYGLARPDFMATEKPETRPHFIALNSRLERAEDDVDHTRELVVGAFELLSMRAAQKTNDTMRVLTFVTVLLGSLALFAGVMGMNFELAFFKSGQQGFLIVTGTMVAITVVSILVALWRKWI